MVVEKAVCYKCVIDAYLGGRIRRKGTSAACSLCGVKRKCIPLSTVTSRVKGVLDEYICEGNYERRWSIDGVYDRQEGDDAEYWVSVIFGCDNVEPIVQAVCNDFDAYSYARDTNYVRKPFDPNDVGHKWCQFQEGMMHGNRYFNDSAREFLGWLFKGIEEYPASSEDDAVVRILNSENAPPIYRARACRAPKDVETISSDPASNLAAPPKEISGEGRMNPAGVPAFYGAFERKTCIAELRPSVGSDVISGEFCLNREVRVLDFGRLEKANLGPDPSFFDPKYFEKTGRRSFLRYLHNEITLPVLPGSERDYLTTQVIAEYLATHYDPRFDGVIFKSVQNKGGQNIVLFSHVASRATCMTRRVGGTYYLHGTKASDAPRIEYVAGSLVLHTIERVKYVPVDQPLPEKKPQATMLLEPEW